MRQINFKKQACLSQKKLSLLTNGSITISVLGKSLSRLTTCYQNSYSHIYNSDDPIENYIIYSPDIFIKTEDTDFDTIDRLKDHENESEEKSLNNKFDNTCMNSTTISDDIRYSDKNSWDERLKSDVTNECLVGTDNIRLTGNSSIHPVYTNHSSSDQETKEYYIQIKESALKIELLKEKKKLDRSYVEAYNRCDLCVQVFKSANFLEKHYNKLHTSKPDFEKCSKCFQYVRKTSLKIHNTEHNKYYKCNLCNEELFNKNVLYSHLITTHDIKIKKTPVTKNPGSRPRLSKPLRDKPTAQGYRCPDCNKYFETSNMRYKHILKHHREGYRCTICGKAFVYKCNLKKHEQIHAGTIARAQCAQCGKFIRADLMYVHVQVHSQRESYECAVCDKRFVSRATYDNHLKYTKAHANDNSILRFQCDTCGKGFRSKGELRDHIHSQHLGKTQHKCPICDKLLSSRRSTTRHVKSVHHGLVETRKDKVCQICGKTFSSKKNLYEHQLIHSGDRPLSCNVCGVTFRQKACLYTHKKRVHKIFPKAKTLKPIDDIDN
ncbi:zinc finger protein 260-like isoform X2 [Zerene cesonia]|nr:zinc finger protein 260-like isoform X2 [Zerene cesonia]